MATVGSIREIPLMEQNHTQENSTIANEAFSHLLSKCEAYLPQSSLEVLKNAFVFASNLHANQQRKSGEPYIIHPIAVAEILTDYKFDETSLVAAILHDVVEDTHVSPEQLEKEFGIVVLSLVDGLTKLAKVHFRSSQEKMAENFRKMIVAMSKDIRVIIIKLADRLHNMRTLKALKVEKRVRIAEETLEIYCPIAGRLGMYNAKAELEDLCLKELKPSVYENLTTKVDQKKVFRQLMIDSAKEQVSHHLQQAGIEGSVYGRSKHFYSIYRKMSDKRIEFEDIYDLFALRIIVDTVPQCYETLGIIHNIFRPVPGRFKDYIAMPKANLYQSLHTTVVAAKGELLEIQIRTQDMHQIAENGIAAHWAYKEKKAQKNQNLFFETDSEKFAWLRQMIDHQKELSDPNEFLEAVKVDLFDEEVFVFSPKGDVFELRKGATCLDFAFEIHSDLGLRTTGSKINGRMTSLRTRLHSGDVVELIVGNKIRATKDWLSFTTTSKARNKIRAYLRSEDRDQARQAGLASFESELHKYQMNADKLQKIGHLQDVNKIFSVGGYDDLLLQIGYGKLDSKKKNKKLLGISPKISEHLHTIDGVTFPENHSFIDKYDTSKNSTRKNSLSKSPEEAIEVQGMTDIVVRMARCCEPLPGQPIVGFVSRRRGVIVHLANCPWALTNDPNRRVECSWSTQVQTTHRVRLRVTTHDTPGILAEITKTISAQKINISGMECFSNDQKRAVLLIRLELSDIHQLKDVLQKLEALDGVMYVERT